MTCIKTGCHVYLAFTDEWARGDAFELSHLNCDGEPCDSVYYFRLAPTSFTPQDTVKHFTLFEYASWFDRHSDNYSTLIVKADAVSDHGYEGKPL